MTAPPSAQSGERNGTAADRESIIYFAEVIRRDLEPGPIKIGVSDDPLARIATMQVGNHEDVELVGWKYGTLREEREMHKMWRRLHVRGEWFRSTTELRYWVFRTSEHVQFRFAMEFSNEVTTEMRAEWRAA